MAQFDALLSELKNQITGNSITSLNQTLLVQYIRPLIAWAAWHEYVPFSAIKTTQKGEVRQNSDNSNTADLNEVAFKRNALKDKITFYQMRLKEFLEKSKDQYPLYRSTCAVSGNNWSIYLGGVIVLHR